MRAQLASLGVLRTVLGGVVVAVSVAIGVRGVTAVAEAALGVVLLAISIASAERVRSTLPAEAPDAPPAAPLESWVRSLAIAAYPSTIGLVVLSAIAAAAEPQLAAFLGGVLIGLGGAALARALGVATWERERGGRLVAERHTQRAYVQRR